MSAVKKLIPHPWLSLAILVIWLLVNNSFSPGQFLLGSMLAIVIPMFSTALCHEPVKLHRPGLVILYIFRLMLDIVTANLMVAGWILNRNRRLQPAFVRYELTLQSSLAISILANTISLTPGTVSCFVSADLRYILIHSLHLKDAEALVKQIRHRYEQLLMEILTP